MAKKYKSTKGNKKSMSGRYKTMNGKYTPTERYGFLRNDYSKMANLPGESFTMQYPPAGAYGRGMLDDSIYGIDEQMRRDGRGAYAFPLKGNAKW